jgi:hypothetical protein
VSEDRNLTASSTLLWPLATVGGPSHFLWPPYVLGLAALVSLLMSGGSGASIAYAGDPTTTITAKGLTDQMRLNRVAFCDHSD